MGCRMAVECGTFGNVAISYNNAANKRMRERLSLKKVTEIFAVVFLSDVFVILRRRC